MIETTVEQRVARGAEWLDKVNPGWEHKIDLSVLDLSDSCRCVLGQVVGTQSIPWWCYHGVSGFYLMEMAAGENSGVWFTDHGFLGATESTVSELDEEWISLLKRRYNTGVFSDS